MARGFDGGGACRRKALGAALTVGALALTYVELNLQTAMPALYPIMFGAVFLMNCCLAYDGYTEAQMINTTHSPAQ